jgi:hypothetical protein
VAWAVNGVELVPGQVVADYQPSRSIRIVAALEQPAGVSGGDGLGGADPAKATPSSVVIARPRWKAASCAVLPSPWDAADTDCSCRFRIGRHRLAVG